MVVKTEYVNMLRGDSGSPHLSVARLCDALGRNTNPAIRLQRRRSRSMNPEPLNSVASVGYPSRFRVCIAWCRCCLRYVTRCYEIRNTPTLVINA
jgi:hypothetical protein